MMKSYEEKVNEIFNIAVYMHLMGSFVPHVKCDEFEKILDSVRSFFKTVSRQEANSKLTEMQIMLDKMAQLFIEKYPLKKSINTIAADWDYFFKNGIDVFSYGVEYGWLEDRMNLNNLRIYEYVPYHFRIALGVHKGNYGIEEEFLLKDAFNSLAKAQYYYELLINYGKKYENKLNLGDTDAYKKITDIKYEVCANSRLTIISFYAFVECFINSIGASFSKRNQSTLTEDEFEILNGKRKGRFLQLKSKIERFQKIIRTDGQSVIITSDNVQIQEPFLTFFENYEQLRNASVHFSPNKESIWLKPKDWLNKANNFSRLSCEVALKFWNACFPDYKEPEYLGKIDYDFHLSKAMKTLKELESIKYKFYGKKK